MAVSGRRCGLILRTIPPFTLYPRSATPRSGRPGRYASTLRLNSRSSTTTASTSVRQGPAHTGQPRPFEVALYRRRADPNALADLAATETLRGQAQHLGD